ncbi:MAG: GNAT family N-acetyltransferase, partial [Oscillospiraceae bacterium]
MDKFIVKKGFENMDVGKVTKLLQGTYWADDRSNETIETSMKNSICFGAFDAKGEQVGFARVITDCCTSYYLCDVIVEDGHRGNNIGTLLLKRIVEDEMLKNLRGILGTKDAHGFYSNFGFEKNEKLFMQR